MISEQIYSKQIEIEEKDIVISSTWVKTEILLRDNTQIVSENDISDEDGEAKIIKIKPLDDDQDGFVITKTIESQRLVDYTMYDIYIYDSKTKTWKKHMLTTEQK